MIDYMLGEQTVSERVETRAELARSESARSWATELAAALAPLAKTPLPTVPGDTPDPPRPSLIRRRSNQLPDRRSRDSRRRLRRGGS